jgi:prolyl oligopeptidase
MLFLRTIIVSYEEGNQQNNKVLKYPETAKKAVIEKYFGTRVIDNYRRLKDDRSAEAWVKAENKVAFDYLN